MLELPGAAVTVPTAQVATAPLGLATVKPAGRISLKLSRKAGLAFAVLSTVKVNATVEPKLVVEAENALVKPGREAITSSVSEAAGVVPSEEASVLDVLMYEPAKLAITRTEMVQLELAVTDAPLGLPSPPNVSVEPPAGALIDAPEHVVVASGASAIVTLAGNVLLNANCVSDAGLELSIVNVSCEVLPGPIVFGENAAINPGTTAKADPLPSNENEISTSNQRSAQRMPTPSE